MEDLNEEAQISKLNSGWAQNLRLDLLWKLANKFAFAKQLSSWNDILDRLWSELSGDLDYENVKNNKENKDIKRRETYLKFNKELYETDDELEDMQTKGFVDSYHEKKDAFKKHREILMRKEQFIRRLQNELGKGTAYKNPGADDWE